MPVNPFYLGESGRDEGIDLFVEKGRGVLNELANKVGTVVKGTEVSVVWL